MNPSYLNSIKNITLPLKSKPSTTIYLLLMVLFVFMAPLISFGQTNAWNSFTDPNGNSSVNLSLNPAPKAKYNPVFKTSTLTTITPNKVDETCPVSNNGSISPGFSNGLANIRYVKLTQKYNSAHQIEEIQAFEIFTGTNVALASNGATATASSFYNEWTFGPQKAIDGDYTGYSFWHSGVDGVGEYIKIDLASAKNLDYLRIYNRPDCCWERGQNMLLELFDASNNLVYSKTVNLWEGVDGPHYIDVNVLDVSWADGATTLNRTGLDSGTYTLNYADADGYSTSVPVNIGSTNPATVGGTISGDPTPICQGSSTGTLTLSGQVGTVVQWERQINSWGWNNIGNAGSITFSETLYSAGTCEYRVLVQNGSCASAYSSIHTIVVNQTPVGGGVYGGNTPICSNASTGNMTLGGGYVGTVVRWEKRLDSGSWTSIANTSTVYSESPSVAGTWEYRAVVGNGSCTEVYSSAFSVTVNPELTINLVNSNVAICQTTTTASFAYTGTTGNPAHWQINFDVAAEAAGIPDQDNGLGGAPGTISVNVPSNVAAGIYNGSLTVITFWPSCSSTSYPVTLTVGVATPTVGAITHPDCTTASGSVILSELPVSGTIFQTGQTVASYPITGTTMTISGLVAGTYNFSTSNGSCTSSATADVVVNTLETNIWDGISWSNGIPSASQALIFNGNYPPATDPDVDISGCSCTVNTGKNVVVKSGHNLSLTNEVTVLGTGTLTFENSASLLQTNNAVVNSGNITYKRTTSAVRMSDYTYWSSPVANQTLNIAPSYASGMFYSYNDFGSPEDWKKESASTIMTVGKGYIIRGPQVVTPIMPPPPPGLNKFDASFIGVPNNGITTLAIGPAGTSNLLGNPYPSALDADAFLATNSALVEGTIYFWTHNTAIQLASSINNGTAGTGMFAYTSDDYASYNTTGGVGTGNFVNGVEQIANKPTGKIAAGQAFFTTSLGSGTITFNNGMRLSSTTLGDHTGVNQQFFKTRNPKDKAETSMEKNRVWLNLKNSNGAFKQTLIGYVAGATNEYDSRFDGESFDANEYVDFYSINDDRNLVIQGRALPFDQNDEVPLGYRTIIDGTFNISIDEVDGSFANQSVYLEDKLTNTEIDLKRGDYAFHTTAGTFNERFVLKFKSLEQNLGATELESQTNRVFVSLKNNQIKIKSGSEPIDKVMVYDVLGKLVYEKGKVGSQEILISSLDSTTKNQLLIVKTTLENGTTVIDKIIY